MNEKVSVNPEIQESSLTVPAFGYELIREILLPDLLGKETSQILYWAGKQLARKYPSADLLDIINFFKKAGWGELTLLKESKDGMEFELSSELISDRMKKQDTSTFQLEAGFIAQQVENSQNLVTECYEQPKRRQNKVIFSVKWDRKDELNV